MDAKEFCRSTGTRYFPPVLLEHGQNIVAFQLAELVVAKQFAGGAGIVVGGLMTGGWGGAAGLRQVKLKWPIF